MPPTQIPVQSRHGTKLNLERVGEGIRVLYGEGRHLAFTLPAGAPAVHFATNILALAEAEPEFVLGYIAEALGVDIEVKHRLPETPGAVVEWNLPNGIHTVPDGGTVVRAVCVADGWINTRTAQKCYPPHDSKVIFDGGSE